ncbi:glycosyltransferase [Vibrio parahaemolyticus]|uniref:glycosyltransferase n=1 Tax=Vibrio TaxID=662 RepID=UPI0014837D0F|nr:MULTISPECIES: glycosyltransferase [Vibrio]EGQ8605200.1 glycosyltransferase [Vibrio parahaemolyticus]EHZ2782100.1 glycosyltransferase [Vibrio parahaemolyticus]EJG1816716.1 glycosyltransferase [Vibrio parahaemolyticus]EKG2653957.1 glycosyltransferase [Vibrio parahaemolyticus]MCR9485518.1 glycosyltransferase [Vibrio alginolyticus]
MYKVSLIMAIYKEPISWVISSLNSLKNQTCQDFEYIIVLDNPKRKEEISQLIDELDISSDRLVLICNEVNLGLTKSLNIGLKCCRGKFIARLDADDISKEERFEKQIDFMESNPNLVVSYSLVTYINEVGDVLFDSWLPKSSGKVLDSLDKINLIAHPSVMMRKDYLIDNNVKYNEDYVRAQDKALWKELVSKGADFGMIREPLIFYRLNQQSVSTKDEFIYERRLINSALFCGENKFARKYILSNFRLTFIVSLFKSFIPAKIRIAINEAKLS